MVGPYFIAINKANTINGNEIDELNGGRTEGVLGNVSDVYIL